MDDKKRMSSKIGKNLQIGDEVVVDWSLITEDWSSVKFPKNGVYRVENIKKCTSCDLWTLCCGKKYLKESDGYICPNLCLDFIHGKTLIFPFSKVNNPIHDIFDELLGSL